MDTLLQLAQSAKPTVVHRRLFEYSRTHRWILLNWLWLCPHARLRSSHRLRWQLCTYKRHRLLRLHGLRDNPWYRRHIRPTNHGKATDRLRGSQSRSDPCDIHRIAHWTKEYQERREIYLWWDGEFDGMADGMGILPCMVESHLDNWIFWCMRSHLWRSEECNFSRAMGNYGIYWYVLGIRDFVYDCDCGLHVDGFGEYIGVAFWTADGTGKPKLVFDLHFWLYKMLMQTRYTMMLLERREPWWWWSAYSWCSGWWESALLVYLDLRNLTSLWLYANTMNSSSQQVVKLLPSLETESFHSLDSSSTSRRNSDMSQCERFGVVQLPVSFSDFFASSLQQPQQLSSL